MGWEDDAPAVGSQGWGDCRGPSNAAPDWGDDGSSLRATCDKSLRAGNKRKHFSREDRPRHGSMRWGFESPSGSVGWGDDAPAVGSQGWGDCRGPSRGSPDWGHDGSSLRATCDKSLRAGSNRKLFDDNEQLRKENRKLQATVRFLCKHGTERMRQSRDDNFVSIIVQGVRIAPRYANKFILANKSKVFRDMFETEEMIKETGILYIEDVSPPVVAAMIEFCYHGTVYFTKDVTSEEMVKVAHQYDIGYLRGICEEDLITKICNGSLLKLLKLARKLGLRLLEAAALEFLKDNFDKLIDHVLSEFC